MERLCAVSGISGDEEEEGEVVCCIWYKCGGGGGRVCVLYLV